MAEFVIKCSHCNSDLQVQDEWIGMEVECPECHNSFVITKPAPPFVIVNAGAANGQGLPPNGKNCPFCGNIIHVQAVSCNFCRRSLPQAPNGTGNKHKHLFWIIPAGGVLFLLVGVLCLYAHIGSFNYYDICGFFESLFGSESSSGYVASSSNRPSANLCSSMEAIKELNIDNSEGETQIAIRKKINLSNQWMLFIFPTDRKEHVQMIDAKIRQIGASFRKYREHLAESKKCRLRDDLDEAESHIKKAQAALQQAGNCHEKVKELLLNETLSIMSNITNPSVKTRTLNNNACDISNVRGPVILLAVESINFGDGFESYQGWYKEYTPFSPVTWDLY